MSNLFKNIQNKTNKRKTIFFILFLLQILLITIFTVINNLELFLLALLVSYSLDFIIFFKAYKKYYGDYFQLLRIDYKGSILLKQVLLVSFLSYRGIIANSDIIIYCVLIISNHGFSIFNLGIENLFNNLVGAIPLNNFKISSSKYINIINKIRKINVFCLNLDLIIVLYILIIHIVPENKELLHYLFCIYGSIIIFAFIFSFLYTIILMRFTNKFNYPLKNEINENNFEAILYFGGGKKSLYQLKQWIDVISRIDKNVLVVVRVMEKNKQLESVYTYINNLQESSLKYLFIRDMKDLTEYIPNSARIVFYAGNCMLNSQMLRIVKPKCHVFLNHGDSDKNVNEYQMLSAYNKLWVAGNMAKDRLNKTNLNIPENRFTIIGRPQTEGKILTNSSKGTCRVKTILYAPTWEGMIKESDYCSLGLMGIRIIETIIKYNREIKIIFKPHPFTGKRVVKYLNILKGIKSLLISNGNNIYTETGDLYSFFNMSDILITDISAVMNDYLISQKPYIVCNTDADSIESMHANFMTTQAAYILNQDCSNLVEIIEGIENFDVLKEERKKIKEYSLGNFEKGVFNNFNNQVNNLYEDMVKKYPA